jgi:hypothetical protein
MSSAVSLMKIPIVVSLHCPIRSAFSPHTIPPAVIFLSVTTPFPYRAKVWKSREIFLLYLHLNVFF